MLLDSEYIRRSVWVSLTPLTFAMVLGLSAIPFFWLVYFFIFLGKLVWCVYLIYVSERFAYYMWSILIGFLGFLVISAGSVAYLSAGDVWGSASIEACSAGLLPVAITLICYLIIAHTRPSFYPFEYNGNRVAVVSKSIQSPSVKKHPAVLLAGATTLAASLFLKFFGVPTAGGASAVALTLGAVLVIFHLRDSIRALRALSIKEKTMPVPYTFMEIDEIRAARSQWWLSRIFMWVASRRKSPGA